MFFVRVTLKLLKTKSCIHSRLRSRLRCASERFVVAFRARLVSPTTSAFAVADCRAGDEAVFFSGLWPGVRKLAYASAWPGVSPVPVGDVQSPGPAPRPWPEPLPTPQLEPVKETAPSAASETPTLTVLRVFCTCCCSLSFRCITARLMIAKRFCRDLCSLSLAHVNKAVILFQFEVKFAGSIISDFVLMITSNSVSNKL